MRPTTTSTHRWQLDASGSIRLGAGEGIVPRRSSLWLLVMDGRVGVDGIGANRTTVLEAGDAIHLPLARLHPTSALTDATLLIAELQDTAAATAPHGHRPLLVREFAQRQSGVVGLLGMCPVDARMRVERPAVASAYGDLLGSAMLSEVESAAPALGTAPSADPVVQEVAARLEDSPGEDWKLSCLAAIAHVGTTVLVDRFRRSTGLAPMQYLRRVRIEQAMQALTSTDDPVSAIARRSGYGSSESFVRAFRAHTGSTPGRWRREVGDIGDAGRLGNPGNAGATRSTGDAAQLSRGLTRIVAKPIAAIPANTAPTAMAVAGPR